MIEGDGFNLDETLGDKRDMVFDCVVSGVPLLNFPVERRVAYLENLLSRIPHGRPVVQLTYGPKSPIPPGLGDYTVEHFHFILRNIPPTQLWLYRRAPELTRTHGSVNENSSGEAVLAAREVAWASEFRVAARLPLFDDLANPSRASTLLRPKAEWPFDLAALAYSCGAKEGPCLSFPKSSSSPDRCAPAPSRSGPPTRR